VQFQGILSIRLRAGRLAAGKMSGTVLGPELPESAFILLNTVGMFRLRAWDSGNGCGIEALRST
jgi:hypothetical protein